MTGLLALVGPTASGKTQIALRLAPELGAEVLSVDSMQVYRGMDVGTAKPAPEERAGVPHHLLDLCEPGKPFSVAEFQRAARVVLAAIRRAGKFPLLVGGSGLYYRAIVDDLDFPPTDPSVRRNLERASPQALWERLVREDPDAASRIEPANVRRIIRALEVLKITGRRFSSYRTGWDRFPPGGVIAAGLIVPPEILRFRIEDRTRAMFKGPLQEETDRLLAAGYRDALEVAPAIGYRQAVAVLDGIVTEEEAIEETVRATAALARRQMRWFRRDPRIVWFDASDLERAGDLIRAYWTAQTRG